MHQTVKRSLALLMAFVMCIGLLPALHLTADAANVDYVYSDKGYIYNWGSRGETATFLSQNAEAFYTGQYTYDVLSTLSGSTSTADVPNSALYSQLQQLMSSKHKTITSYDGTKNLYQYTDCQNSGNPKTISSFYSGVAIGPAWGEGGWNREHTWPNSKGYGNAENDIMMLRPTATSENSSRGNTAYGESSGFYNPNSASNGKYDLRGDVARIMLYVYVRWGNISYMWGASGVIESREVLLKWMEADPVDTWELGRNDSVQSITGTRNVFVDYPELAFILFGEEVPAGMTTPSSSGSSSGCQHSYASVVTPPTCTEQGYTTYTCSECGYSKKADYVAALGHSYGADGICTRCGAEKPAVSGAVLVKNVSELQIGDRIIIVAAGYDKAMNNVNRGNNRGAADVTKSGDTVGYGEDVQVIVLQAGTVDGTFAFYVDGVVDSKGSPVEAGYLCASSSSSNQMQTVSELDANGSWAIEIDGNGVATIKAQGENTRNWIRYNDGNEPKLFSCYGETNKQNDISIYKIASGGSEEPDVPDIPEECVHEWGEWGQYIQTVEPTADKEGVRARHCQKCSKVDYEILPKLETAPLMLTAAQAEAQAEAQWTLVTDASTLRVGDKIIIAAANHDYAMGAQNGKYRDRVAVTKSETGDTITGVDQVEVITLEAGAATGTFAFKVSDGYLYAPADGNNLKTITSVEGWENNSSWNISIADGETTILANIAEGTQRMLLHNNSNPRFSCYKGASSATPVSIYRLETNAGGSENPDPTPDPEPTPEPTPDIVAISAALAASSGEFTVKGVVTLVDGKNIYIQDATGAICIYMSTAPSDISLGDTIIAKGSRKDFNGLPELEKGSYEKSEGMTLSAKETTIGGLTTADICTYIILKGVEVTEVNDNNGAYATPNITVKDASGNSIQIYKAVVGKTDGAWDVQVGDIVDVTAAVSYYNKFQLRNTLTSEIVKSTQHVHAFSQKVTVEKYLASAATCAAKATYYYSCECGDKGEETFEYGDMLPHTPGAEATCTTAQVCTVCNTELVAALGHEYVDGVCTVCGGKEGEHIHAFTQKVTVEKYLASAATCSAKATYYYSCECGDMGEETFEYGDVADHAWGEWEERYASNCSKEGLTFRHCVTCGIIEVDVLEAPGHTEAVLEAVAPTCTDTGLTEGRKCAVCGEVLVAQTEVAALGHNAVVDAAIPATCTTEGKTEGSHCDRCNTVLVKQETVAALGHDIVDDEDGKAPTCTETGRTPGSYCSRCDYVETAEIIPALGHDYSDESCHVITAPTCTEKGCTTHTCMRDGCGYSYADTYVDALGHTEVVDAAVPPSCTAVGLTEGVHCSVCNAVLTRQNLIPALGHTEVVDAAVAATCTTAGLSEGRQCTVCGEVTKTQEVIPALGHTWVDATYDAPKTCQVCGATEGDPLVRPVEIEVSEDVEIVIPESVDKEKAEEAVNSVVSSTGEVEQPEDTGIDSNTAIIEAAKENIKDENGETVVGDSYETSVNITMGNVEVSTEGENAVVVKITYDVTPYLYALSSDGTVLGRTELNNFETEVTFRLPVDKNTTADSAKVYHEGELMGMFPIVTDENGNKFVEVKSKTFSEYTVELHHHEYEAVVTAPTCTEDGWTIYTCSCGNGYPANLVPALGHTEVVDAAVAATCTTAGLTEGKHCSVCGEVLAAQSEVPATGHRFGEWTVTREATTQEAGEETRTCACGEKETRSTPKLEPTPTEPTQPAEPGEPAGPNTVVIVVIVVVALGAAAAVVFVVLKKKRA